MRCARSRAGTRCSAPRRVPAALPERAAPRRGAVQEGGGDGEARPPTGSGRTRAPAATPTPRRSTAASGPRRRSRAGAIAPPSAWSRSRRRCPPPRRPASARAPRASWCRAGMVLFDRNRNLESEAAFAAALSAPGLDADLECRARFYRAQSVWKQRQRTARRAAVRRGGGRLRARGEPRSARQGAVPGRALLRRAGNREAARARYARVEAEHADHSYADDARIRAGGAGDRRGRRRGRGEDPRRGPDALPQGRPAERGAVAPGLRGLARGARRRGAALAGREPAPRPARGDLVRGGARPVLEGARAREAGASPTRPASLVRARRARVPAVGLRAAVADPAQGRSTPSRGGAGHVAAQGAARRPRLVVSAPRPLTASPGFCAPWSWRAWARAATRAASWPGSGWRPRPRSASPGAARAEDEDLSGSRRPCSTAAASGARRTRCPATA